MADEADEIARKLTKEAREAIIGMKWSNTAWPISYDAHANGEYCCERHATTLGIEVRARLSGSDVQNG